MEDRELKESLTKKLIGYSAAAGAALALGVNPVQGALVYTPADVSVNLDGVEDYLLDFNGDGRMDFRFGWRDGAVVTYGNLAVVMPEMDYAYVGVVSDTLIYTTTIPDPNYAFTINLPQGARINDTLFNAETADGVGVLGAPTGTIPVTFTLPPGDMVTPTGQFLGHRGFLGAKFDIGGGSPYFGWVDVQVTSDQILIYGWAYEDESNMPINAGAPLPVPGSLQLLALGAAGLFSWRQYRRRKNSTDDTEEQS